MSCAIFDGRYLVTEDICYFDSTRFVCKKYDHSNPSRIFVVVGNGGKGMATIERLKDVPTDDLLKHTEAIEDECHVLMIDASEKVMFSISKEGLAMPLPIQPIAIGAYEMNTNALLKSDDLYSKLKVRKLFGEGVSRAEAVFWYAKAFDDSGVNDAQYLGEPVVFKIEDDVFVKQ